MQTQAYFDNIQLHILNALRKANSSIHIAVAWFTDQEIFRLLCEKAGTGVKVELIIVDDAINRKSPIEYQKLTDLGGLLIKVGNKKQSASIMHNKFCVIDGTTIINGSYNWSRQAQENWENITIITNHPELAKQFLEEFDKIMEHSSSMRAAVVDYGKIVTRLEALRNVIELNDDDDIDLQLAKLKKLLPESDEFDEVRLILELVKSGQQEDALNRITSYVNVRKQVVVYSDPEIPELTLELKALEMQLGALEVERTEMEKLLHAYSYRYNSELGDIVRRILKLRSERYQEEAQSDPGKQEKAEEARQDYESFEHGYKESRKKVVFSITQAEQEELKALFRACSKLCHPDLVAEHDKHDAAEIFKKLNYANEKNDIASIKEIYENLKQGIFNVMSSTINDAIRLHKQVVKMRGKLKDVAVYISNLRTSANWLKVSEIKDWDRHFAGLKEQFQKQLDELEAP